MVRTRIKALKPGLDILLAASSNGSRIYPASYPRSVSRAQIRPRRGADSSPQFSVKVMNVPRHTILRQTIVSLAWYLTNQAEEGVVLDITAPVIGITRWIPLNLWLRLSIAFTNWMLQHKSSEPAFIETNTSDPSCIMAQHQNTSFGLLPITNENHEALQYCIHNHITFYPLSSMG